MPSINPLSASMSLFNIGLLLLQALSVAAHGDHGGAHDQIPVAADADWATRHMAEEHHINSFDAGSFFNLHDYNSNGFWTSDDIKKTYGLLDESTRNIPQEKKDDVVQKVLELYDADRSGSISFAEYTIGTSRGLSLPDFGFGPGHHGDDEYEYEIHHFEKYHSGDDVKEEDLTHPEDIEHFRKHDQMDEEAEKQEKLDSMGIVEANIPRKFRRAGGTITRGGYNYES